ncbi:hypothetical protein ILUMI_20732 [Ignelater luminosus]|uniref:Uncharacterized protein n=1 Tax=Ignelater luminosus TaxID=2038154 RepID=A0A8K0CHP8_IGNLU|nr:hypothetical protein ILUMI_20732 [Ignelater luminosus]
MIKESQVAVKPQQKINSKFDKTAESDNNEEAKSKVRKKTKNKKIKGDENSNAQIVDAMESILKDNEKFRSTPIRIKKTNQTQNEDKKSGFVLEDNVNKVPKKKIIKKPVGSTQIGNALDNLENKITTTLKQNKAGKTTKVNSSDPKNNMPLASKTELAKTLFSGQSWIEGNKALKESTNILVSLGNSNLDPVLSKEIVFKTNNGKCRKPFGLPQQICKEEMQIATEAVPVTPNEHSNIEKSDTHIDKAKGDLNHNYEISNKAEFSTKIIIQTPETSVTMNTANTLSNPNNTDTEMILQTAAEKPLANLTETLQGNSKLTLTEQSIQLHTSNAEVPLKYFQQKYIESNIHITSKTLNTNTQQIPAEPHLKVNEEEIADGILPPGIFAEPNLKIKAEKQEEININTRAFTEMNLETNTESNKSQLDLKASEGTTKMKLKPITKTIKMFNSLNEKSIEMKVKIFTEANGKKFPKVLEQNNINTNCSTSALECYAENNKNTTKTCIEYSRTAQQALSVLNDEVSSVLHDSFCNIDDIWQRVCRTMDEINECSQQYNKLQEEQNTKFLSQSTPQLPKCSSNIYESKDKSLLHALSLGLVQTQSENQVRLAVLPVIEEISDLPVLDPSSGLQIPPLETDSFMQASVFPEQDEYSKTNEIPILPKLIPVIETYDQPCTVLKQQKRDVFNIPPRISTIHEDDLGDGHLSTKPNSKEYNTRKSERATLKTPSTLLSKIHTKKFSRDLSPEVKQKLKEIALRLGLDDLPRMKAQQNIHAKLIKEFDATDSLIEFQRQMKQINEAKARKDVRPSIALKDTNSITLMKDSRGKKRQPVQIMAEELYVPEKKINKIAATNLNPVSKTKSPRHKPKCCQFLYREKKKKKEKHSNVINAMKRKKELDCTSSNTLYSFSRKHSRIDNKEPQQKYSDSLWFSNNKKKDKTR